MTQSTATAATAASAALPPARSVSIAGSVERGCEVAAMPSQAITGERPGSWKSRLIRDQAMNDQDGVCSACVADGSASAGADLTGSGPGAGGGSGASRMTP